VRSILYTEINILNISGDFISSEFTLTCKNLYESPIARALFGDSLHPGGLEITKRLGKLLELNEKDTVLDVACGRGNSALFLNEEFGCEVVGIDVSSNNISVANKNGDNFLVADATQLPFKKYFSAIVAECSFCLFTEKEKAMKELNSVLKSGGRIGLSDFVIEGQLPEELNSMLMRVACIGDGISRREYQELMKKFYVKSFFYESHNDKLMETIYDIGKKISMAEKFLPNLEVGGINLKQAKELLNKTVECIEDGRINYSIMIGRM